MKIEIFNNQKDLNFSPLSVKQIVKVVMDYEKESCDAVEIHFVDKKKMQDLHQNFFSDPSPTDCICFPMDGNHFIAIRGHIGCHSGSHL